MLFRQTLLYLPAQLLGPLLQFAAAIVWTHFLAPTEMGVLALIVAAQELIVVGTLSWFTFYTIRHYDPSAPRDGKQAFLATETAVVGAASLIAAVSVLLLPWVIETQWTTGLIAASLLYTLTRNIATHWTDRSRAEGDTVTYSIQQILWPLLGLTLGTVFVNIYGGSAAAVLAGYGIAQVITLIACARRMDFVTSIANASRSIVSAAYRYGFPLLVGCFLFWIANNGLRYVLEHAEGAAAVGLVTVGCGLGLRAANMAAMLVTAAAFPLAVAHSREHGLDAGQSQLIRNGVLLLAVLAPVGVGLWLVATPLIELLVAEPFREMTAAVLPLATLAGIARNLRIHFATQVFVLREDMRFVLINDTIDAVAAILGAIIGLAMGGLVGAVAGSAVGAIVSLIIDFAIGAVRHRFHFPFADLGRIGLATTVMALAVLAFPEGHGAAFVGLEAFVGAAVYGLMLALLYPELRQALAAYAARLRARAEPGA